MDKIFVIRYEETYSDGTFHAGEDIKERTHDLITEDGFIFDFGDEYTKYIIEEMELK